MSFIEVLKSIFGKKKAYDMPYRYAMINWTEYGSNHGLGIKKIELIEGNSSTELPYTRAMVETLKEKTKVPIFDMTQGKSHPDVEVFEEYNPAILELRW